MLTKLDFLSIIKKNTQISDESLLLKAYVFSEEAHKNQKRESGEPYFVHPLAVAIELSKYKLDESSIIAGLLHDVVEDTKYNLDDIEKNFGKEISYLVDGLTKINIIKSKSKLENNAENFRKLILSTAKDIRILIIKLIDRLNNLQTINGINNIEKRKSIANETLVIFVPLAERIGMYNLRLELEDLAFKTLMPDIRQEIINNVKKMKQNQNNIITDIVSFLHQKIFIENNIKCKILGREKNPYSIYKKMQKKSLSFDKLRDIIAFRVIVKNIQDCYKVFGIINSNFLMIPNTFKDYINRPKNNGYQSLHFVIIGPKNVKLEIQIRTEEMDIISEYGIASHWMYKDEIKETYDDINKYNFLKELVMNISDNYNAEKYQDLKYEIYEDEIFCYTKDGDIINLPINSTPIDFAFAISKEIGYKCKSVKINGVLANIDTKLESGDDIEIITDNKITINKKWLNFVKTVKAKIEIKNYLKKINSIVDNYYTYILKLEDISGILAKIVNLCAKKNINIISINTIDESVLYQKIELKVELESENKNIELKNDLKEIKGVLKIY